MENNEDDDASKKKQDRIVSYVYQWRWKYSSILNSEHLLSLVTMVYILMNCDRWINNSVDDQALFAQRDGWSKLLHFYCSDMIEQCQTSTFQSLSIEILCCHWQDLCLELRDAARKLLEKELDHLHGNAEAWPIFLTKWSNLFNQLYKKENDGALDDPDIRDIFLDDLTYSNETTVSTINQQYKTQQLLSIILIGIVGARYGQEIEPTKQANAPIKGFSVESPEMILKLSGLLTRLLSTANFEHIPLHSTLRRTAIDLIGRGYTIWEPYIDIGQVLLILLDLCAASDSTTVSSNVLSGILTPKTDTCLTARTALTLIATTRSNVVITTLTRELAKHVLAQSGTGSINTGRSLPAAVSGMVPSQALMTIKNGQKNEILRLIKILIEKCPHDVAELILEVTDITLNCIDLSVLRHKGVQAVSETFALLLRYPMVTYCNEPAKLCVGTKTGVLALYDLKSTKYQPFQAHPKNEVISCIEFSPDGKYLASYSAYEGILYFWQTTSSAFFSSSNTIHLVSRHAAQRLERSIPSPMKKVDMNWIDRTSVRIFWHVDRSEKRFTV